jgi:lipopolysaccharide biosynthesis glycosyltransferase
MEAGIENLIVYKDTMHISILCSDLHTKYLTVLLYSISTNNKRKTKIWVLEYDTKGISVSNKKMLSEYASELGDMEIEFVPFRPDLIDGFEKYPFGHWSMSVYLHVFLFILLPETVERVLKIGTDTIVTGCLDELYDIDFKGNVIATCQENPHLGVVTPPDSNIQTPQVADLLNSDVVLFNLKQMREENITKEFYLSVVDKGYKIKPNWFLDQDLLAFAFFKRILWVDPVRWNCRSWNLRGLKRKFAADEVSIIHYTGHIWKPWLMLFSSDEINKLKGNWYMFLVKRFERKNEYDSSSALDNELVSVWWNYAQFAPNYQTLLAEMTANHNMFIPHGNALVNYIYELRSKLEQKDTKILLQNFRNSNISMPLINGTNKELKWNYDKNIWYEETILGDNVLLSKQAPGSWNKVLFYFTMSDGKRYHYDFKVKYRTANSRFRFLFGNDKGEFSEFFIDDPKYNDVWRHIEGDYSTAKTAFDFFFITSTDLTGDNAYVTFDYLKITEEPS